LGFFQYDVFRDQRRAYRKKAIQRNIVADAPIPHTEVRKTAEPTGSYEN